MKTIFWLSIFLGTAGIVKFIDHSFAVWRVKRGGFGLLSLFASYDLKPLVFAIACFIVAFNIR